MSSFQHTRYDDLDFGVHARAERARAMKAMWAGLRRALGPSRGR